MITSISDRSLTSNRARSNRRLLAAMVIGLVSACASAKAAPLACGSLKNHFGPHDYRTERGEPLRLVEGAHFTPAVEALVRGRRDYLGGDLDYTLRAFPNHHRALMSVMRYGERTKSPQPPNMRYSVECYFERALRFQPDDTTVRMIYAMYLQKTSRHKEANQQLERAAYLAKDNAFTHYNIGLIYLEGGNHVGALREAHRAYALGFSRPELKDRLIASGHWRDSASALSADAPGGAASAPASSSPH